MPDDRENFARFEDYAPKRRFRPVRFRDIRISTDRPYLVSGLIPREALTIVWGGPKSGKTFWVLDVMLHVALGWEYRGRRVQPGVVVYIGCEGERGFGARTEAFRRGKLSEDGADPPLYLLATRLDLVADVDELITDIRAAIGADRCAAIVIDTLNKSISGSESRDEDMGAYVRAADRVREAFRAAVIVIHHCGHNDNRPRGHTSLIGAADAEIAVKRDDAGRIIATVRNMKDGPEGDEIFSRLTVVEVGLDDDGEPITSCVIDPVDCPSPPKASKMKKLAPAEARALELLTDAIARDGTIPDTNNHIPQNIPCIKEELWRESCYLGSISKSDKPDAKRIAFARAAERLVAAGRVGKWDCWVWLVA